MIRHIFPLILLVAISDCHGRVPTHMGMVNGRFTPCPESPNCVSSFEKGDVHGIDPIPFRGGEEEAMERLVKTVERHPRAKVITRKDGYMRAEYTSLLFRFVDDVEFFIDGKAGVIHLKSASRLGYSDMGVNRKRAERIREDFLKGDNGGR